MTVALDSPIPGLMTADKGLTKEELAKELAVLRRDHSLSKAEAADLIGVSERTVNNWLLGEREIPRPVGNYLLLLKRLSPAAQKREIARIRKEADPFPRFEGIYSLLLMGAAQTRQVAARHRVPSRAESEGQQRVGLGCLVAAGGRLFGADSGGVTYDGSYGVSETEPGYVDIRLEVMVPRGVTLVTGKTPKASSPQWEARFEVVFTLPPSRTVAHPVETPYGTVDFVLTHMRELPADWHFLGGIE